MTAIVQAALPADDAPVQTAAEDRQSWHVLAILSALMAFASLSTDVFLPALPTITRALNASAGVMALTMSSYLVGLQPGPAAVGSDRRPRRAAAPGGGGYRLVRPGIGRLRPGAFGGGVDRLARGAGGGCIGQRGPGAGHGARPVCRGARRTNAVGPACHHGHRTPGRAGAGRPDPGHGRLAGDLRDAGRYRAGDAGSAPPPCRKPCRPGAATPARCIALWPSI